MKVNVVEEDTKPAPIEWLVDSVAVHLTNCKQYLNNPTVTSQAVTSGSGKVMASQFKGTNATVLVIMTSNTLEPWNWNILNSKKKTVILSGPRVQSRQVDQHSPQGFKRGCKHNAMDMT